MSVQGATIQHLAETTDGVDAVAAELAGVVRGRKGPVALHEPTFIGNEVAYVTDCVESGWVSTSGSYVTRFEDMLSDYTGIDHAIAVVSGTAALHTCLMLAGVQRDDEVLMPAMTFVATANAVTYCGATPHFVDIESRSLGIDTPKLVEYFEQAFEQRDGVTHNRQTGRPVRALIVMHALGNPADLDAIGTLCRQYGLRLIEDAAQALGSHWNDQHVGGIGDLGAFSFNGNKTITCGGGGAVVTNHKDLATTARHLTTTAKSGTSPAPYHDAVGYNYRMPNINAALGLAQLETLPELLRRKQNLASHWVEVIDRLDHLGTAEGLPGAQGNHWLTALVLSGPLADARDLLFDTLRHTGIETRPLWTPMHWLPMYRACPAMNLDTTESLFHRTLCLPGSADPGAEP